MNNAGYICTENRWSGCYFSIVVYIVKLVDSRQILCNFLTVEFLKLYFLAKLAYLRNQFYTYLSVLLIYLFKFILLFSTSNQRPKPVWTNVIHTWNLSISSCANLFHCSFVFREYNNSVQSCTDIMQLNIVY